MKDVGVCEEKRAIQLASFAALEAAARLQLKSEAFAEQLISHGRNSTLVQTD